MERNRQEISKLIFQKLKKNKTNLQEQFLKKKNTIPFFFIDDLLPKQLSKEIHKNFPKLTETVQKKNFREYKHVAYQMDKYNPLLEEILYAFQEPDVVKIISEICNLEHIYPDEFLYAGGLSLMAKNNFLNPHLDNSHDKERKRWRVLNLLYYVTPNWKLENGGNLELWQHGIRNKPITVISKFNRLVVMTTHQKSWHSVSKVNIDNTRCCVSNYYFANQPFLASDKFHITTFRGKSNEKTKDVILKIDNILRNILRKFFTKGIRKNPHQYKKNKTL